MSPSLSFLVVQQRAGRYPGRGGEAGQGCGTAVVFCPLAEWPHLPDGNVQATVWERRMWRMCYQEQQEDCHADEANWMVFQEHPWDQLEGGHLNQSPG